MTPSAFLKNYTSEVPAHVTIGRIEQVLIRCGVTNITKEYGAHAEIAAILFSAPFLPGGGNITVRLPADEEAVLGTLWLEYAGTGKLDSTGTKLAWPGRKTKKRADFRAQAERTAWRIVQDWVEVQMSLIKLQKADPLQVFLSYVWDRNHGRTFYDLLKENQFKLLPPP